MIFKFLESKIQNITLLTILNDVYEKIHIRYPKINIADLNRMLDEAKYRQHFGKKCSEFLNHKKDFKDPHNIYLLTLYEPSTPYRFKHEDKIHDIDPKWLGLNDLNKFRKVDLKSFDFKEEMLYGELPEEYEFRINYGKSKFGKKFAEIEKEITLRSQWKKECNISELMGEYLLIKSMKQQISDFNKYSNSNNAKLNDLILYNTEKLSILNNPDTKTYKQNESQFKLNSESDKYSYNKQEPKQFYKYIYFDLNNKKSFPYPVATDIDLYLTNDERLKKYINSDWLLKKREDLLFDHVTFVNYVNYFPFEYIPKKQFVKQFIQIGAIGIQYSKFMNKLKEQGYINELGEKLPERGFINLHGEIKTMSFDHLYTPEELDEFAENTIETVELTQAQMFKEQMYFYAFPSYEKAFVTSESDQYGTGVKPDSRWKAELDMEYLKFMNKLEEQRYTECQKSP